MISVKAQLTMPKQDMLNTIDKSPQSLKFNNFLTPKKELGKAKLINVKPLNIPKPALLKSKIDLDSPSIEIES